MIKMTYHGCTGKLLMATGGVTATNKTTSKSTIGNRENCFIQLRQLASQVPPPENLIREPSKTSGEKYALL